MMSGLVAFAMSCSSRSLANESQQSQRGTWSRCCPSPRAGDARDVEDVGGRRLGENKSKTSAAPECSQIAYRQPLKRPEKLLSSRPRLGTDAAKTPPPSSCTHVSWGSSGPRRSRCPWRGLPRQEAECYQHAIVGSQRGRDLR